MLESRTGAALAALFFVASQAAAQAPQAEPALPYTVQKSDKLIRLARELLIKPGDWAQVARYNRLSNPDFILPGQTLQIPLRLMRSQQPPARIVSVQGEVTVAGQPAAAGAPLAEGQPLQTGANSSAVVQLADGSRVKLMPGGIAEVSQHRLYQLPGGGEPWFAGALRLARGSVETLAEKITRRAAPLQVITPTSAVGVRGTQFRVGYDAAAGNASRTEVTEGRVRADNTAQRTGGDLPAGTGAVIDPAVPEVRAVPLLPAPDLSASPGEVSKPEGQWPLPTLAGAVAWRVQVAADGNFDRIVRDLRATGTQAALGSLDTGAWFLRVRAIDASGLEGFDAVKPLQVRLALRITDSWLAWAGGRGELRFTLEGAAPTAIAATLARDAAITDVLRQDTLTAPRWDVGALRPGRYYVRLALTLPGGGAAQTQVHALEVPEGWGADSIQEISGPLHTLP